MLVLTGPLLEPDTGHGTEGAKLAGCGTRGVLSVFVSPVCKKEANHTGLTLGGADHQRGAHVLDRVVAVWVSTPLQKVLYTVRVGALARERQRGPSVYVDVSDARAMPKPVANALDGASGGSGEDVARGAAAAAAGQERRGGRRHITRGKVFRIYISYYEVSIL